MRKEELEDLRLKYAEMLTMRLDHDAGIGDRESERRRMARLAERFPGALREIDDLELDEIRRRVAALDAVLFGSARSEPWMPAIHLFHSLARGALCAKRWLAGRKHVDATVSRAYSNALHTLRFPEDARTWTEDLGRVAIPPRGRLLDVIFERMAAQLQTSDGEARRLVFGTPRRERFR